jgi:hypothetical protein
MNGSTARADASSVGWQVEELEFLWKSHKIRRDLSFKGDAKTLDFRCFAGRQYVRHLHVSLSAVTQ